MSMYKCPVCGELFSTSYKKCPFCEEDDLLMDRRKTTSRRSRRNEPRAVGPLLIVIFLMLWRWWSSLSRVTASLRIGARMIRWMNLL